MERLLRAAPYALSAAAFFIALGGYRARFNSFTTDLKKKVDRDLYESEIGAIQKRLDEIYESVQKILAHLIR
jgi:hypothetical protein